MSDAAVDAILEIFAWVGGGLAILVGIAALIAYVADGSWAPAQVVITDEADGSVARWFGHDGRVGQAPVTPEQRERLGGRDVADMFVRLGARPQVRLTRHSPLVRFLTLLAVALLGLGLASVALSLVLLFAR